MSKADDFVKARQASTNIRPKIELKVPDKDGKCLFRVGLHGHMEYHHTTEFTVMGEYQGDTYPQFHLSAEEALKLAEWIQRTFK